jgi:hypothetical protein
VAKLKVVTDGDVPPVAPKTLKDAVDVSERALLVTIRAKIAAEIDGGVPPHTLAPLTRQLRDIDKEIRLLDQRAHEEAGEDDVAPDEAFDAEAL